jgi:hypothetical protein
MTLKLGTLTLEQKDGRSRVHGQTASREQSSGLRTEWQVGIPGHPGLLIHDTAWQNGEREIVIARPDEVPPMPKELSALLGRMRAGVTRHDAKLLRMDVYMAVWDAKDNRARKMWPAPEEFEDACGPAIYGTLLGLGVVKVDTRRVIQGDESRQQNRTAALLDPAAQGAPIALYAASRVVPTLRVIGWL